MSTSSIAQPVIAIEPDTPVMLSAGLSTSPIGAAAAALETDGVTIYRRRGDR
jgi:hypothetical protein